MHDQHHVHHGQGIVTENVCVAEDTWRLALEAHEVLPPIGPGQFVMLRLPHSTDPLLGRPLAVYRTDGVKSLEVLYIVVGKMTQRLARVQAGAELEFWTPLGQGFSVANTAVANTLDADFDHTIMVAGGIGQTPFLMLCEETHQKEFPERKTLLYGARSKNRLAGVDDFQQTGVDIHLATEDGSIGHHGLCTELIEKVFQKNEKTRIFCCGPHPMLRATFDIARRIELPCWVSLETPMSCGLGICFGCVVKYRNTTDDGTLDYKRTCVDGPVFDAYRLIFSAPSDS